MKFIILAFNVYPLLYFFRNFKFYNIFNFNTHKKISIKDQEINFKSHHKKLFLYGHCKHFQYPSCYQ